MLYLFFGNNCKGTRARSCDRQHIVQSLVIRIHHKTVLLRKIFCSIGFHNDVSAFVRPLYIKAQHFKVLFQTVLVRMRCMVTEPAPHPRNQKQIPQHHQ